MALDANSMAGRIKTHVDAIAAHQDSDPAGMAAYRQSLYVAMCQGIIEEIVANSELVPVTTDSGPAGAGIITGKVK
jgi:hypothetical protein